MSVAPVNELTFSGQPAAPAGAGFYVVSGNATDDLTVTNTITAGNFLVLYWAQGSNLVNTLASVSDNASPPNTWTVAGINNSAGANTMCGFAFAYMAAVPSIIHLNWTNTDFVYKAGTILQFSGVAVTPQDGSPATVGDDFRQAVSAPITPLVDNDLIVTILSQANGGVPPAYSGQNAGWIHQSAILYDASNLQLEALYTVLSGQAGSAQDPGGSYAAFTNWRSSSVAFKAAATTHTVLPDADLASTGWTTTPLFSKVNDASDATLITATLA